MLQGKIWQTGHTREYVKVAVPGEDSLTNRLVRVKVEKLLENDLLCGTAADIDFAEDGVL